MNIGVSISKADEMRYRMSQAFFFKNRDDSNNENVLTLPVQLFRQQKNKPLLIYPSRCSRDS